MDLQDRKERGLCANCPNPRAAPGVRCHACRERIAAYSRERREALAKQGLCRCGNPLATGYRQCKSCRDKGAARTLQRKGAMAKRGLCYCGTLLAPGHRQCEACLERAATRNRRSREVWVERGVCHCGKARATGRVECRDCLGLQSASWKRQQLLDSGTYPPPTTTAAPASHDPHYLITYALIVVDRSASPAIRLHNDSIYFCGLADTLPQAEGQVRSLVNAHNYGSPWVILPRVFTLRSQNLVLELMYAQDKYERVVRDMNEAAQAAGWYAVTPEAQEGVETHA